jgi:hypothetical protein
MYRVIVHLMKGIFPLPRPYETAEDARRGTACAIRHPQCYAARVVDIRKGRTIFVIKN